MPESRAWTQFAAGLEAADICGVVIDVESREIVWAGPRFCEFSGIQRVTLVGTPVETLFLPPLLTMLFETQDAGPIREFPLEVQTGDRGICRALADLNSTRVDNRELMVLKIHVSRTSAENLGTDAQFRALVDTLPTPALMWRPDTYEILYVNSPLEDIWGLPRGNIIGRRTDEFVLNLDYLKAQIEMRLKGAPYSQSEVLVKDEFGRVRTWIGSSSVIGYEGRPALITAVTDITDREEIELALRRSQQNFSLLVDNLPEGIIVHCDGRVVFANPVALEMSGYESLDELKDTPVIELMHPDDRAAVAERMRAVISGRLQLAPMHERVIHRNGTVLDVEIAGAPTDFEGKPAALIIARDISESLAREAAMRESEVKYRTLVESVNDTIFQLDAEGRFTFMSAGNEQGLQLHPDVVGRSFAEFIHPGDLESLRESYRATMNGVLKPHEFRIKMKDGLWRHVRTSSRPILDNEGRVVGLIGVMVDLTERIEQENTLKETAAKLAEATRIAKMSTWELNPAGEIWTITPEIFENLGIAGLPAHEQRDAFTALIHPEDAERLRALTLEAIERTNHYEAEFRCVLPNGDIRHLRTAGQVERRDDGRPRRMYGVTQDITEQKRQEEERLQIEVQLQRAQKLDSLTVLAGGVAHDFNNLLTGILGYSELIKNAVRGQERLEKYVDEIQGITRRAADLTRQLLAYSGRGAFVVKPIDIGSMFLEFRPLLEAVMPRGIVLIVEPIEPLPLVKADSTQVKQILMNLVLNASESFQDQQGKVRLAIRLRTIEMELPVDANRPLPTHPGRYVSIEVADNGAGMSEDRLKRVCDPFYSTKFVGRGLGLSAVHGIVQSHAGAIHIASELGHGTTVEILLPIVGLDDSAAAKPARRATFEARILVVDDEPHVRAVVTDILTASGFEVIQAADGEECIEIMADRRRIPDLVVLDLTMPGMSGEATLAQLHASHMETPVILTSGYSVNEMRERDNGRGGPTGFLQKPFNAKQLVDAVRSGLLHAS